MLNTKDKTNTYSDVDAITSFRNAILEAGITINEPIIADGEIHRFNNNKSGWYVCHGEYGAFGVWGKVDTVTWTLNNTKTMSPDERKQLSAKISQAKAVRDKELKAQHEAAAEQANNDWLKLKKTGKFEYLKRKQVKAYGVRFGKAAIAVPLRDIEGKVWNLQVIYHDGKKRFQKGGRKKGCFHVIGELKINQTINVCEGYATGASIYEATGVTTVIAFDAGNLEPVISAIKSKHPNISITIAADDDCFKEVNTGRIKAEEVANKHGCNVIFPEFCNTIKKGGSNA